MFTFSVGGASRSRREFLRIGSLALGGLSLPGLLAARAGRLEVVRSFGSGNAYHQNYVSVAGGNVLKTPTGSLYARVAGPNDPRTGLPTSTIITPEAAAPDIKLKQHFETQSLHKLTAA